jgi:hypothetical protein
LEREKEKDNKKERQQKGRQTSEERSGHKERQEKLMNITYALKESKMRFINIQKKI